MRDANIHTVPAEALQPYSAAFEELGLDWAWDPRRHGEGAAGLRAYLEQEHPHLLRVYDVDFLMEAVEATRARLERTR